MLPRTVMAGLAAATLIAAAALNPSVATAAAGGRGGSGNWPQSGTWNWPEGAQPSCTWTQVQYNSHGKTHTRWARVCP